MSSGAKLISAERDRQVRVETYSASHDSAHKDRELVAAAVVYCYGTLRGEYWPWRTDDYKPKDEIRDLVRAGALIAAEIDRLLRAKGSEHRCYGTGLRIVHEAVMGQIEPMKITSRCTGCEDCVTEPGDRP